MKRAICSSILALAILAAVSPCSAGYLRARTPLKNRYIVQLKNVSSEQVEETSKRLSTMFGGRLLGSMRYAMKGFGVEMTEAQARVLAKNPLVDVVEDQLGFMSTGPQSERRERTGAPLRALAPQSIPTTCTWRSGYWDCPLTDGIQNWGLDRLSRLDLSSATRAYQFATTGQAGYPRTEQVRVYVIGTGIYATHDEFEGRVDPGHTMTTDPQLSNPVPAGSAEELPIPYDPTPANDPCVGWRSTVDDQMGHDTAVASVIGGRNTGVAKNAILVPVKVWTCAQPSQGPQMAMLGVARGIDWAIGDAQAHNARAVINMSLGFDNGFFNTNGFRTDQQLCESQSGPNYVLTPCAPALENEVNQAILNNIPVVVSANNQASNRCAAQTPARMGQDSNSSTWAGVYSSTYHTITVGGTMATAAGAPDLLWRCEGTPEGCQSNWTTTYNTDGRGSNFGACVSIYAPAWNVRVAGGSGPSSYRTPGGASSGTSFSAAIVSGLAARLLELNSSLTPLDVWNSLKYRANQRCTPPAVCPGNFDVDHYNNFLVYMARTE